MSENSFTVSLYVYRWVYVLLLSECCAFRIFHEQGKLADMQLKVGEISQAMSDIITALDAAEADLNSADQVKGDPKFLETQIRKLQVSYEIDRF